MTNQLYCLPSNLPAVALNSITRSITSTDLRYKYNQISPSSMATYTDYAPTVYNFCERIDFIKKVLNSNTYRYNTIQGYNKITNITGSNNVFLGTNEYTNNIATSNTVSIGFNLIPEADKILLRPNKSKGVLKITPPTSSTGVSNVTLNDTTNITIGSTSTITLGQNNNIATGSASTITIGQNNNITTGNVLTIDLKNNSQFLLNGSSAVTVAASVSAIFDNNFKSSTDGITFGPNTKVFSDLQGYSNSMTYNNRLKITVGNSTYYILLHT